MLLVNGVCESMKKCPSTLVRAIKVRHRELCEGLGRIFASKYHDRKNPRMMSVQRALCGTNRVTEWINVKRSSWMTE